MARPRSTLRGPDNYPAVPPPKPKPKPKPKGGWVNATGGMPPPQTPSVDPAQAEAQARLDATLAFINKQEELAKAEIERSYQNQLNNSKALAQAIQSMGLPAVIQGLFTNAAQSQAGLAGGFSQEMQGIATDQANEMGNLMAGSGVGGIRNEGQNMGDVTYGMGGFMPARTFTESGTAFASDAALQPAFALQQGAITAAKSKDEASAKLSEFALKRAEAQMQLPEIYDNIRARMQGETDNKQKLALAQFEAGFLTSRDLAKAMGIKNWKKYPAMTKPQLEAAAKSTEPRKASSGLSSKLGILVDEYGAPILSASGKVIHIPKDENWQVRNLENGGIARVNANTGEIQILVKPGPDKPNEPSPYQHVEINDKAYVFDPNSGTFYDPVTGKPVNPNGKGSGGKPLSRSEMADAWKVVRQNKKGYWGFSTLDEPLTPSELRSAVEASGSDMREFAEARKAGGQTLLDFMDNVGITYWNGDPKETYLQLVQMGVPPATAKRMVARTWPETVWDKMRKNTDFTNPKGKPASGGLKNVSYVVTNAGYRANSEVIDTIVSESKRLGLDPYAVMAVALSEGGLDYGAVGDSGTSYGPFQLHVGGALPKGKTAAWANSPAGIKYALGRIASVAKGKRGRRAIEAIVRRFERPADPDSEIDRAWGHYQKLGESGSKAQEISYEPTSNEWHGSHSIAQQFADVAKGYGLKIWSEKRNTKATASGGISDHWTGSKNAYAYDLSGSVKRMDAAAKAILQALGESWDGKSAIVKNFYHNGYRIQVLYRTNVGGNHFNHIHVGVRYEGSQSA